MVDTEKERAVHKLSYDKHARNAKNIIFVQTYGYKLTLPLQASKAINKSQHIIITYR